MRPPLSFIYGNCVFADRARDVWAAFAIETESYRWLGEDGKRTRFLSLLGALEAVEADVQIVRVARGVERGRLPDPVGLHAGAMRAYTAAQERRLALLGAERPELFVLVSLSEPERDVASYVSQLAERSTTELWRALRDAFSRSDRRLVPASELERLRVRADRAHARLAEFLAVREARTVELQWLVRRAFCRGVGEPVIDGLHEPRALVFERNGEAVLAPLQGDVMRWGFVSSTTARHFSSSSAADRRS